MEVRTSGRTIDRVAGHRVSAGRVVGLIRPPYARAAPLLHNAVDL